MGTYAGQAYTNLVGDLLGWGTVWFHPKGITNILALHEAKNKWRVTYDSTGGNMFKIHKPDQSILFVESSNGLYEHNTSNRKVEVENATKEK
eukprot:11881680-Ditylum_brightwellii.AAC.1